MPTAYYNKPTKKELHAFSLRGSDLIAELTQNLLDERPELTYEQAQKIIQRRHPNTLEGSVQGYADEEDVPYLFGEKESEIKITNWIKKRTKERMKEYGESLSIATIKASGEANEAPELSEHLRSYTRT